jgi:hypothetical protein
MNDEQRRVFWERLVRKVSPASPVDYQTFLQAYHLVWFIYRDKSLALAIVRESIDSLEAFARRQDKRRAKDPQQREVRNQILLGDRHLLQLLVFLKSEQYEKEQEQSAAALSEEDMTIRFIEYMACFAFYRNPFYAGLGMAGVLHRYTTTEAMAIHDWVDPERARDETYWYGCRRTLLEGLERRFGQRLRVDRNARGELRLRTQEFPERHAEMIARLLRLLAPWGTKHVIPQHFDPSSDALPELTFQSADHDCEPQVEINRLHAFFDPCCFERLTANFGFEPPPQHLELPRFFLTSGAEDEPPRGDRNKPPELNLEDLVAVGEWLAEQKHRRKRAAATHLAIVVDGVKRAEWDLLQASRMRMDVRPEDRLLEIIGPEENLLLASCLLSSNDPEVGAEPVRAAITLEGGQRISFIILPARNAAGQTDGASVEIAYRETHLWRAAMLFMRRLKFRVSESGELLSLLSRPKARAIVFLTLFIICFAFSVVSFVKWRESRIQRELVGGVKDKQAPPANERQQSSSPAPAPAQQAITAQRDGKRESSASDQNKVKPLAPRQSELTPAPGSELARKTDPSPPEVSVEEATRRTPSKTAGVTLDSVKQIYVDPLGAGPFARRVRAQLIEELKKSKMLIVAETREQADAVLKGTAKRQHRGGRLTALLVNFPGDELWNAKIETSARKPEEIAAELSAGTVRDLLDKIRQAERQRAQSK